MWQAMRVAVVVPAYREGRLIGLTLAGVPGYVDTIVVVDDASPDDTLARARASGRPELVCVRHPDNRGVGAAIVTGYRAALQARADVVAVMAGDNQMHPDDLAALLAPIAENRADYVKGNRLLHPAYRDMPLWRRAGTRALAALTRAATGLGVGDTQCGYTAISANLLSVLPLDEVWPRYGYPNDLLGMIAARGRSVTEVAVRPVYAGEESGLRVWHLLSIARIIGRRWLRERQNANTTPLRPRPNPKRGVISRLAR